MDFRTHQQKIDLGGSWQFAYSDSQHHNFLNISQLQASELPVMPCTVPGNFELDLQANGIIGEPFYGMNMPKLFQYEKCHIWYFREFDAQEVPGMQPELLLEGLDCYADIYLNGTLLASTDNMLIEHCFDLTGLLQPHNELLIHIRPAVLEAKKYDYPPILRSLGSNFESLYVRKAAHMFGWDIMPRAVSAGIWRPITLRYRPVERLERAYLRTSHISPDHQNAHLYLSYQASTQMGIDDDYQIVLTATCGDSQFSASSKMLFDAGKLNIYLNQPKLWWPKGRGDQSLYDVQVQLLKNGEVIDTLSFTHGIRTVKLNRTSITDAEGSGEFCFEVNGEKLFVLGTNWVPSDAYHSRDVERIPAMLELVDDIGCNMIRCWGGNVYENNLFYEICDRKGIMIWQDFSMACANYPQDAQFQSRLEHEARLVVQRLRQHPCIALWSGDNECDYGYVNDGVDPNTNVLTRELLPRVLREEVPGAPYLPSSPYIDTVAYAHGSNTMSEDHLWGPRDYYKGPYYQTNICHFASETGYHGCPSPESMRKFLSPESLWPYKDNKEWLLHSISPVPGIDLFDYRVELMASHIKVLFGEVPDNLEDFADASQISQAEAMKFFIERFRMTKWRRTGIIWWNIIDGAPQISDAVVDYYFAMKRAYHVIKQCQQPFVMTLSEPAEGVQRLIACNDTREGLEISYQIIDVETGQQLCDAAAHVPADSSVCVQQIGSTEEQGAWMIRWQTANGSGHNYYLTGKPPYSLQAYRKWTQMLSERAQA